MSTIDDKLEQSQHIQRDDRPQARATLEQLSKRWGVVGGLYWMIEKKAPKEVRIKSMGPEEVWELDGEQHGIKYKEKSYKKVK